MVELNINLFVSGEEVVVELNINLFVSGEEVVVELNINLFVSGEEVVVEEEEEFEVRSEEDSDDIPEEVTFSQSRAAALAQISSAMKQTRDATAEKRAKRKNQDALFKQQKVT